MKSIWTTWSERPLAWPLTLMAAVLGVSAVGFAWVEARTQAEPVGLFEGLWWACVTLFTVGYGDFAPKTVSGRVLGMLVMASGIGLTSTVTGALASVMVERRIKKRRGLLSVTCRDHILILGHNAHARTLLQRLARLPALAGRPAVLVADLEPSRFEEFAASLDPGLETLFVRGEPTARPAVERANPAAARLAYVLSRQDLPPEEADNQSVLAVLTARALAPDLTLYAEAQREAAREHLMRAGATRVLSREEITGRSLAFMAGHPVMHDVLLALVSGTAGQGQGAERPRQGMSFRPFTQAEKSLDWGTLVRESLAASGRLPLGVCRLPRELKLGDLLDTSQALDSFIMDMVQASGRDSGLGRTGPRVLLNPAAATPLADFDGLVLLEPGS